jgi:hypothetical protein
VVGEKAGWELDFGRQSAFNQWTRTNMIQEFVAAPALAPPEAQVDAALLEQYQKEMQDAAQMPLPDEDDADL